MSPRRLLRAVHTLEEGHIRDERTFELFHDIDLQIALEFRSRGPLYAVFLEQADEGATDIGMYAGATNRPASRPPSTPS